MEATAAVRSSSSSSFVARGIASIANAIYELVRRFLLWMIAAGPIPTHVAIIMDGNRRYAARRHMNKTSGHEFGYSTLMYILRDCYELGVKCVSVYAFSIENFRRSEEEVEMLMNLMQEKLQTLIEKESIVREYGIRVQVVGNLSLLPEHVRRTAEEVMAATKDSDKAVLNIFAPYTSTQEIVRAVEDVCQEVITTRRRQVCERNEFSDNCSHRHDDEGTATEEIEGLESAVTAEEIERRLYTSNCPEPQLLIRTSGEIRLSNFLLWQSSFSLLYVTPILWPEFRFRHLLMAIVEYQRNYPLLQEKQRQLKWLRSCTA